MVVRALGAPVWARRLRCGLDSSMQKQGEKSRNAMRHGLQTVPESLLRQKDKENSVVQTCRTPGGKTSQDGSSSKALRDISSGKGNRMSE